MILIFHDEIKANKMMEDEKNFSSQKYKHHSSNRFIYKFA
jgi:hypothetical protein